MSLESKLIFALGLTFALFVGLTVAFEIILPAFEQIDTAFQIANGEAGE